MHATRLLAALVAVPTLTAVAVRADTVTLRNGSRIEGVVMRETDEEVVLQLGTGRATLRRSAVASIARADAAENRTLAARWQQKYAAAPPPRLTPALQALAAEFAKLGELRAGALRARETLGELATRESEGQAELEEVRTQLLQVSAQMQEALQALRAPPNVQNPAAQTPARRDSMLKYNALVSSNTVLQVRWDRLREARAACRTEGEDACRKMNAYLEAIQLFCARFESERKPPAQDREGADRQPFLEELGSRLAAYLRDFAAVEAPVTRMGGGASVAAVVNGEHPARLLVDTGASCVMVTETFVRRMKVDPATLPEAEFTVADGRKIMGHSMTFRTLAVGGAQAENVEAGVLPEKPNESLDGLLGMSFLRHFTVRLDGASGKMTLWQFQPKRAGGAPAAGAP